MKKLFAIALGLSETASAHVRRLQNSFWKKTGDISHISLLPLVPIVWSSHQFAPFEQLSIPPMPQEVSFGHLMTVGGYLFLGASDDGWLHTTEEIRRLCVPAHGASVGDSVPLRTGNLSGKKLRPRRANHTGDEFRLEIAPSHDRVGRARKQSPFVALRNHQRPPCGQLSIIRFV